MKALWISSLAWNSNGDYPYDVDGSGAISGSMFEQSLICGLEDAGVNVDIINSYPYKVKKTWLPFEWSHNGLSKDYTIGRFGSKYINNLYECVSLKKMIRTCDKQYDVVIVYLVHSPFMSALKCYKKRHPNTKTILICPDLFDMMDMSRSIIRSMLKKLQSRILDDCYDYVDGYVLFTEYMVEKLPVGKKPTLVIEGVNSISMIPEVKVKQNKKFVILYAGSLQFNFGIENIIKAITMIDDCDIEFHIYGDGKLEQFIKAAEIDDSRIRFMGFIDHEKLIVKEQEADLLINARNPNSTYTRYSFPSKTFEYMMSGTPFLTTRLMGIPEEYYKYVYVINDNEPQTIVDAILSIINSPKEEVNKRVMLGIEFLLSNKNKTIQSRKLADFMSDMINNTSEG